ncbi:MAG: ferric reductase-like transmembrane domain-containing protein [Rhodobacteraceae bacterium]|nr:ferric reductase-like transmembrane domain-containing protein [Paracoccaceae bacterium]
MQVSFKSITIAAGLGLLVLMPLGLYFVADVPRRSLLKEALSLLTIVSFVAVIAQLFLARSDRAVNLLFKAPTVQRIHRIVGYGAIAVLALHPFLIVLPRYFEAGVRPLDALVTMLTTFESLGVVLGLIAWGLMMLLGVMALFRMRLIRRFGLRYRGWRAVHGGLAAVFLITALWHAMALGRHTGLMLGGFLIALAATGLGLLARLYLLERPRPQPNVQGAST